MTFHAQLQAFSTQKWFYAEYETFSFGPESSWYSLHLSGYSGNTGDSMSNLTAGNQWKHNGYNFTTLDSDNDKKSNGNCAEQFKAAWWFNNCWLSCLTCRFGTKDFSWITMNDFGIEKDGKLLAARMLIRSN